MDGKDSKQTVKIPAVFSAPIRPDVVKTVHRDLNKNARQAYAVYFKAGHEHSAESWGTGRAVARVPRISGSGTSRSGQGAFANSCRGGRMFAPTKVWRRWHRKVSVNQRRFATVSAIAATAVPSLVFARGHKVEDVQELPLVLADAAESLAKTKAAVEVLKGLAAYADVERVIASRTLRAGKGKGRNRRFRQRRGPLVVYKEDKGIVKAFRNIPGVELASVYALNPLVLAPGGHLGRFVVWTRGAMQELERVWGSHSQPSALKSIGTDKFTGNPVGYTLPQLQLTNTDIGRIINSAEVQSVLRPAGPRHTPRALSRRNPLRNQSAMFTLNPYVKRARQLEAAKAGTSAANKNAARKGKRASEAFVSSLLDAN